MASLFAQRRLADAGGALSKSYERLSSGQRINRASDDAAGLAVATTTEARARVLNQAVRNVNDGISLINIVDGALNQLSSITARQLELAEQAANGSYSKAQRQALDKEAFALSQEYNRILASTEYNGIKPFTGSGRDIQIMAGLGKEALLGLATGRQMARTVGTGVFDKTTVCNWTEGASDKSQVADINKDGISDVLARDNGGSYPYQIYLGQGNGNYTATGNYFYFEGAVNFGDFNGDGNVDLVGFATANSIHVYMGNGSSISTSESAATGGGWDYAYASDLNNDGKTEILALSGANFSVYTMTQPNQLTQISTTTMASSSNGLQLGDVNGDGFTDVVTINSGFLAVYNGQGNGTFRIGTSSNFGGGAVTVADYNHDGYADLAVDNRLYTNARNDLNTYSVATFGLGGTLALDYDSDGDLDAGYLAATQALKVYANLGDGTFSTAVSSAYVPPPAGPITIHAATVNRDGVPDLIASDMDGTFALIQRTTTVLETKRYDLLSAAGARSAIDELKQQQERISNELGALGATLSRMETGVSTLGAMTEHLTASVSRIKNADVAEDAANLARVQILQQSAAAVLGQANQAPQIALELLR